METLAIDIGNTRASWACFKGSAITSRGQLESFDGIGSVDLSWGDIETIGIGSVDPDACRRLLAVLESVTGIVPIQMTNGAEVPIPILLPDPASVGTDRALNALAWSRREPGRGAVILDAGTALTVDAVSNAGEFLGGWIAPGLDLSARALATGTALLPTAERSVAEGPWGTDTSSATSGGIAILLAGGARALRDRVLGGLDADVATVVTGGDGDRISSLLGPEVLHLPHLTLEGIALGAHERQGGVGD